MSIERYVEHATEAFTMPDICLRLREMLDSGNHHLDDISGLIAVDPNLSAKVLRLANSALFRFSQQIDSITKAISVIGGEALYNIVMSEVAASAFKHFDTELVDISTHWHHSVYCGMAAKSIAKAKRKRAAERFFVMGILQGLSQLVVAHHTPEVYETLRKDKQQGLPWEREKINLGFTFAKCSGLIMERWQMPVSLYYAVQNMHDYERVKSDSDVAIVTMADQITLAQMDKERYAAVKLWQEDTQPVLGLQDEDIAKIIEQTETDTARVASILLS